MNTESVGIHPLIIAAKKNDVATAQRWLAIGADIDTKSSEGGVTPLMVASALGHIEMVELLLKYNPDLSITHHEVAHCKRPAGNFTAVDYAACNQHHRVVERIRRHAKKTAKQSAKET